MSERLVPLLAHRAELVARLERIEGENRKLQADLDMGAGAALLRSPAGIVAVVLALVLGAMAGVWSAKGDAGSKSFMGNVF